LRSCTARDQASGTERDKRLPKAASEVGARYERLHREEENSGGCSFSGRNTVSIY